MVDRKKWYFYGVEEKGRKRATALRKWFLSLGVGMSLPASR